jgi:hypothetical protein
LRPNPVDRAALREVRRALLEADVALDVVRSFTDKVRAKAVGANVIKSVTPGQMVVKIVTTNWSRRSAPTPIRSISMRPARRHHDGRPAGLGQDHHHRQDRQAPDRAREARRC